MPDEMALLCQAAEMVLQRVAAGACDVDQVGHCGAAVLANVVDDLDGQLG